MLGLKWFRTALIHPPLPFVLPKRSLKFFPSYRIITKFKKVTADTHYPIESPKKIVSAEDVTEKEVEKFLGKYHMGEKINLNRFCHTMLRATNEDQVTQLYAIANSAGMMSNRIRNLYLSGMIIHKQFQKAVDEFNYYVQEKVDIDAAMHVTLLWAYCKQGKIDQAWEVIEVLKEKKMDIETRAYRAIMNYYFDNGEMRRGLKVFEDLEKEGRKPDLGLFCTLLRGYRMSGLLDKSIETFERLKTEGYKPDVLAYTELLQSYGAAGKIQDMVNRLQEMKDSGLQPSHITYTSMCWIFVKHNQFESAFAMLEGMVRERQVPLDINLVEKIATWLANRNRKEEAVWCMRMAKQEGQKISHMLYLGTPHYGIVDPEFWKVPHHKIVNERYDDDLLFL